MTKKKIATHLKYERLRQGNGGVRLPREWEKGDIRGERDESEWIGERRNVGLYEGLCFIIIFIYIRVKFWLKLKSKN